MNFSNKLFVITLMLILGLGLFVSPVGAQEKPFKVAAISGYFAQGLGLKIVHGLEKAEEDFNIEFNLIDTGVRSLDYEEQFQRVAESGDYELIFVMGWELVDALTQTATSYPDQKFIFIDGILDIDQDNMLYINFLENEGAFMAGAMAALMTQNSTAEYANLNNKKIGFVGGRDIPVINNFRIGYEQGAKYIDAEVKVTSVFAGTFDDPGRGLEMARSLYDSGHDIIFNVAGPTGEGVIQAAQMSKRYAIGVDVDQCPNAPGYVAGSMIKKVDVSVYNTIEQTINGNYTPGSHNYGVADDGVELDNCNYMQEIVPEEILNELEKVKELIANDEIEIKSVM